jgi:hypothetical protein
MKFKAFLLACKDYAGAVTAIAGAIVIFIGVHNWIERKNEKIESAVTKEEIEFMLSDIKHDIDSIKQQNYYIMGQQSLAIYRIDQLNSGFAGLRSEMVRHIRRDNSMTEAQKIDDILRLVKLMNEDMGGKQPDVSDTMQYKIKVRKIENGRP